MYNLPSHQPSNVPDNSALRHAPCSLLFALLSLFLAFSACKDTTDDQGKDPSPKIKKWVTHWDAQTSMESTFTYDAQGRIFSEVRKSNDDTVSIQYDWLPGKVVIKYHTSGWDIKNDTLILNDKGLHISKSSFWSLEYDTRGYLVKNATLMNNIPYLYTYRIENGNTVQCLLLTGKDFEKVETEYVNEFLPNSVNTIGYENMGITFYGKQDKNLMAKSTSIYHYTNHVEQNTVTYVYELDALGRVVKQSTAEHPDFYNLYTYYE